MTLNVALRSLWPAEFSSCPNSQPPCHRWFDFSAWILEKFLEFTELGYMLGIDYSVSVLSRTYCVLCFIDSVLHVRKLFLNHYNFFLFLFWILYLKDTDHPCYLLHNKLPQNLVVNSTHFLYRHFCGSGIQHDVAGPSASVSHKATFKVLAQSLQSHLKPRLGKDLLPSALRACWQHFPHGVLCWQFQFFADYCLEAMLCSLPHEPLPHGSFLHQSMKARKTIENICWQDKSHGLL